MLLISAGVVLTGCVVERIDGQNWTGSPVSFETFGHGYFPAAALKSGKEAVVGLQCRLDAAMAPTECRVIYETTAGYGFGEAALNIARRMVIKEIVAVGGEVRIPVAFCTNARRCGPLMDQWTRFDARTRAPQSP